MNVHYVVNIMHRVHCGCESCGSRNKLNIFVQLFQFSVGRTTAVVFSRVEVVEAYKLDLIRDDVFFELAQLSTYITEIE